MEKTAHYPNDVMVSAAAALLFFGPLIRRQLHSGTEIYIPQHQEFILWWCQVWESLLWGLFFFLIVSLFGYWFDMDWVLGVGYFIGVVLSLLVVIWMVLVGCGVSFQSQSVGYSLVQKRVLLGCFLPIGAGWRWLKTFDQQKGSWWLKEAQIWRLLVVIVGLVMPDWYGMVVILSLLFLRIGLLILGKDIFAHTRKQFLHKSFGKYVEEVAFLPWIFLVSLVKGTATLSLGDRITHFQSLIFHKRFFGGGLWLFCSLIVMGMIVRWVWVAELRWKFPLLVIWIMRLYVLWYREHKSVTLKSQNL